MAIVSYFYMKIILRALLIGWLVFIFVMSAFDGTASAQLSGNLLNYNAGGNSLSFFFNVATIRDFAHAFEFFILYLLVYLNFGKKYKYHGILFCFLYCITDEIHQYFVPGRAFELADILRDSGGILSAFLFTQIYENIIKRGR